MLKKRIISTLLVLTMVVVLLASCSSGNKDSKELNIFSWDGYYPQDVLDDFEDKTGIKVNYTFFTSNEEMLEKLASAKGGDYDIILASDYIIEQTIQEDLVAKLNKEQIPNYKNIDEAFLSHYFDSNNEYTVPYGPGTPLIVYDPALTDLDIKGYDDLWDESLKNNVVLIDTERVITGVTLMTLGESMNTEDEVKIREAGEKLIKLAPNIRALDGANPQNLMTGEVAAGFLFTSQVLEAVELNPSLEVVYPEEGMGFGIDSMFIPKNAPNMDNAHEFLNFILDPEIGARVSEQIFYMCPNKASKEFLSEDFKNNKALYIPSEILGKTEFIENISDEAVEVHNEIWTAFIQATGQ